MLVHDGFPYRVSHTRAVEVVDGALVVCDCGGLTRVEMLDPNDPEGTVVAVGEAFCHPTLDRFSRRRGREIALGRAMKQVVRYYATPEQQAREGEDAVAADWFSLPPRDLERLLRLAFREAEQDGFCYLHFHDAAPAKFIILTPERYDAIVERLFPGGGGIPVGDPEWSHSHATPEMANDSVRLRTKSGRALTDADVQALADEAERGYDVSQFVERRREP